MHSVQFNWVQSLSHVRIFSTPWIAACQASLSITISRSSLRLTSIKLVMPFSHLIFCHPLFLPPPIPPSIRVFSNESTLCMRWQSTGVSHIQMEWTLPDGVNIRKFTVLASFLPKNTQGWFPLKWTGWISLQSKGLSRVFSNTTV